jgi:hypothetical protein
MTIFFIDVLSSLANLYGKAGEASWDIEKGFTYE